jgi:CheY-like chemotaxis protein
VVSGVEDLLRRLIGEHITMMTVAGRGLERVKVDPMQLELIIMNLAVNARDAMPGGGRLTIETSNVHLAAGQVGSLAPGSYVMISVADTGHGMDAATAARIFEPFFTTKPQGKGTGLGLSTAHGIASQSGGTLTVESALGQGTTFRVYLPAASGAEAEEAKPSAAAAAGGTGTLLVVEDHPPLRSLISTILGHAGYRVFMAANAQEALRLSAADSIDLVLTDVVMPGMSGPDLVEQLRAHRPNLRVVFMSGYDQGSLRARGADTHYLQKPFKPRALLAKIAEVLGSAPGLKSADHSRPIAS